MIQKCANPECDAKFLYANRGRIFSFDLRHPVAPCRDVPVAICEKHPSHATINFWLCDVCASKLNLHFTRETGLTFTTIPTTSTSEIQKSPGPSTAALGTQPA